MYGFKKITVPRRRSAPERTEDHPRQVAGDDPIGFSLEPIGFSLEV
jgi:hypothetical protein